MLGLPSCHVVPVHGVDCLALVPAAGSFAEDKGEMRGRYLGRQKNGSSLKCSFAINLSFINFLRTTKAIVYSCCLS